MTAPAKERHVYHVGPWRRAVPWLVFSPFLLLGLGLVIFGKTTEDRTSGALIGGIFFVVTYGTHALISYAQLILTTEGVRLRQFGMNLQVPWSDIEGLRLDRGREGLVTRTPMTSRGAANLAAVRGLSYRGAEFYSEEQQLAMAEQRWIPIEAFAHHLRRGNLQETIARLAPAAQPLPSLLESVPGASADTSSKKLTGWRLAMVIALCCLGVGLGIAMEANLLNPRRFEQGFTILLAVIAPLSVLRAGWSARNSFRMGAKWLGVMFVLLTLITILWCIVTWDNLAKAF